MFRRSDLALATFNPIVHFWLHHTVHCAEKIVSARLQMVGQVEVGQVEVVGVTDRVL